MVFQVKQLRKLRAGAGDKPSSPNANEKVLADIHGSKYKILLDHPILKRSWNFLSTWS